MKKKQCVKCQKEFSPANQDVAFCPECSIQNSQMDTNDYPDNVYSALTGESLINPSAATTEALGVLIINLSEKQQTVIELLYRDKLTPSEISVKTGWNCSDERIKQLEAKALCILRRPEKLKIIDDGDVAKAQSLGKPEDFLLIDSVEGESAGNEVNFDVLDTKIGDMHLGIRIQMCLEKAGIKSLRVLIQFSKQEVEKISNLGEGGAKVVTDALAGLGLFLLKKKFVK